MAAQSFGYSCRPLLKGLIEEQCFSSVRIWFSLELNPAANVDSSNPQRLYERWKHIASQGDHGDRSVKNLRDDLYEAVRRTAMSPSLKRKLRRQIGEASIDLFRPEKLRLDLSWIAESRGISIASLLDECRAHARANIEQPQSLQPDEYLVDGLPLDQKMHWCRFL